MKNHATSHAGDRPIWFGYLLFCSLLLLLGKSHLHAQPNPRHPNSQTFPKITSFPTTVKDIWKLGDISGDGIDDYALKIDLDTLFYNQWTNYTAFETRIYHGIPNDLPPLSTGERIGPSAVNMLGSVTKILAVGDWDGQNGIDICTRIEIYNDTSYGNDRGYDIPRTVIFWNDGSGHFSVNDTTHLSAGVDAAYTCQYGVSTDVNRDGIDDLILRGGAGLGPGGRIVTYPSLQIFLGNQHEKWGKNEVAYTSDWQMWHVPDMNRFDAEDLDADGAIDFTFVDDNGPVSVLYGKPGGFPDTTEIESLNLSPTVRGSWSLFSDVTGDGIADFLVLRQRTGDKYVSVYVGCKGQRLLEQFGSGDDPPSGTHPWDRWWGKPWAKVLGPSWVSPAWPGLSHLLFDLGSADSNATEEVWVVSEPFLLAYDVGGRYVRGLKGIYGLDSVFDGEAVISLPQDAKRLGDIDGDGHEEFAVINYAGVHLYHKVDQLPIIYFSAYQIPDGRTKPSGITETFHRPVEERSLHIAPNPARGVVRISWERETATGNDAEVIILDMIGQEVTRIPVAPGSREVFWDASETFGGRYGVVLRVGELTVEGSVQIMQ